MSCFISLAFRPTSLRLCKPPLQLSRCRGPTRQHPVETLCHATTLGQNTCAGGCRSNHYALTSTPDIGRSGSRNLLCNSNCSMQEESSGPHSQTVPSLCPTSCLPARRTSGKACVDTIRPYGFDGNRDVLQEDFASFFFHALATVPSVRHARTHCGPVLLFNFVA